MARCFDVPRVPSIIAAQLSIMLFASAVRVLAFLPNFASIPGLAVIYAPHLLAFGLLARLSPERPRVLFIAGGLLGLLFYSLYCDPLWTALSGLAWIPPFAVVTFSPARRDTILIRCAGLGGCVAVLLLSGALEYVYSLSQYTARVQFTDLLERSRTPELTSVLFRSEFAKWFYCLCVPGWALGIWLLHGRPRILILAGAVSSLSLLAYSVAFLYLPGHWWLPIPLYIEHTLFALFWTAAIAGYWGGLQALAARAHRWINESEGTGWRPRMRLLSPAFWASPCLALPRPIAQSSCTSPRQPRPSQARHCPPRSSSRWRRCRRLPCPPRAPIRHNKAPSPGCRSIQASACRNGSAHWNPRRCGPPLVVRPRR